jgi:NADH:ubiquinone oxidoreductase subunit 6 (subunit J)
MRDRPPIFYTEAVITTIISLVAASMWIEWFKGIINRHFQNNPSATLIFAVILSLFAIIALQYLFANNSSSFKKVNLEKERS